MYLGDLTHKGIRTETASATFELDSTITSASDVGKAVGITGNYIVGYGAADQEIVGYLESFENRTVEGSKTGAVNWHMCAEFAYTGADPVAGDRLALDGSGGVKVAPAGVGYNTLVTAVDTTNKIVSMTFR